MFYNLLGFCSKQYMYKALIYSSYMEYRNYYENLKYKYPTYHCYMTVEECNKLGPEFKNDIRDVAKKQSKTVDELVDLIRTYCKKYPQERICQYEQLKTYDQYPYRFTQSIPQIMNKL